MSSETTQRDTLLIEWFANQLGFNALAARTSVGESNPAYLYVVTFVLANVVFGAAYDFLQTGTIRYIEQPFIIVLRVGVILGVVGIIIMANDHAKVERRLRRRDQVTDRFTEYRSTVPLRGKLAVYAVIVAAFFAYELFVLGVNTILQTQGPVLGILNNLIILPLCYIPVGVELVLVYTSVHILLPRRLANSDLSLFFIDTRNMGGFQPVGNLLKKSYYIYTGGLVLYLVFFYGPVVIAGGPTGGPVQTGPVIALLFTMLWLLGVVTLSYSMYRTHRIMAAEKAERLDEIEEELNQAISDPHEISQAEITDPDKLESIQFRLEQVRGTSEYPTTFTMWTQIGISVVLPQVLQLSIQYI